MKTSKKKNNQDLLETELLKMEGRIARLRKRLARFQPKKGRRTPTGIPDGMVPFPTSQASYDAIVKERVQLAKSQDRLVGYDEMDAELYAPTTHEELVADFKLLPKSTLERLSAALKDAQVAAE